MFMFSVATRVSTMFSSVDALAKMRNVPSWRRWSGIAGTSFALVAIPSGAIAFDQEELYGTFKLVSATRKLLDSGEVIDAYGKRPTGFITYGRDGRMLVIIAWDGRPKPTSIASITAPEKEALFTSMLAYGGSYTFDGKTVEHHIDISWNEVWTGTTQTRDVTKEGDRLTLATRPAPFSGDGKMSVTTLVWEKVR